MSVTALQVESLPTGDDSMRTWVESLRRLVHGARRLDVRGLGERELVEMARSLTSVLSHVTAVKLAVVAEADRRSAARRVTGATSTAAWLRADGMGAGAAGREVTLAGSLLAHEATRLALFDGRINPEQAQLITGALDSMSDAVADTDRAAAEVRLLERAKVVDPGQLRKEALAQAARVDPAGSGDLARRERAAKAGRDLTIWRGRHGMHHLRGMLDPEAAAVLAAALDPLAVPAPAGDDGGRDPRSPGRRRADALVELARRALAGGGLPVSGGVRPQVVVTMTLDQLRGELDGCAQLAGATVREPLSAGGACRIACDAGIIPAVLGSDSEILDWGRAVRTATPGQRRALAHRDGDARSLVVTGRRSGARLTT